MRKVVMGCCKQATQDSSQIGVLLQAFSRQVFSLVARNIVSYPIR